MNIFNNLSYKQLATKIKLLGENFKLRVGISKPQLHQTTINKFIAWLNNGNNGTMQFMQKYNNLRLDPHELMPEVNSIICCRFDYLPNYAAANCASNLNDRTVADHDNNSSQIITPYATCRDYHKIMRQRLQQFAKQIAILIEQENKNAASNNKNKGSFHYRIFCDSAPVMEKALAVQAGLGWIGKNTLLINKQSGSYSFLGEIYTNLDLTTDSDNQSNCSTNHINHGCGTCTKCLDACPTKALYSPYTLDARRCIAYLTIEHTGAIPVELRPHIGKRIFGCSECQKFCPWNIKYASNNNATIFTSLPPWDNMNQNLAQLFLWDEVTYLNNTTGTPLRRLGYERWLRNIAVALGNSTPTKENLEALAKRLNNSVASELVREHTQWAVTQLKTHCQFNSN